MNRNQDIKRFIFVLDTNVLLFDPNALMVFYEHDLMIPITVIEEIDRFKKDLNENEGPEDYNLIAPTLQNDMNSKNYSLASEDSNDSNDNKKRRRRSS